jgi:hypothetical protein
LVRTDRPGESPADHIRSHLVANDQSANPFRPGNGVLPAYLAGREKPLAEFDAFLADSHPLHANWTVTGLRGTGKTVLVETAAARAEAAGWLTLQRELGERHRDDTRMADALEEDVDALRRRCGRVGAIEQSVIRSARLLHVSRIAVAGLSMEPEPLAPRPPADRMSDALMRLDEALKAAHRPGALLLYDEGHLLADDRSRERYPLSSLLAALGAVQRSGEPRVRIVLTGLPTLSINLKRARTYAERMFRHVVLANLERGDAWDALTIPLSRTPRRFSTSLVGEIVEATAGYPYFVQWFGAYLWRAVPADEVTTAAYRSVEPALLHELDLAFFEDRFEGAAPAEQAVLVAMARQRTAVDIAALRGALPEQASLDTLVRRLVERGLLYRSGRARYDFALPMFRAYLGRRERDLTELTDLVRTVSSEPQRPRG